VNYTLSSGPVGNVVFLEPRVDPVEREVVLVLQNSLAPATEYTLHVTAGSNDPRTRLAAFDGVPFAGETKLTFTTEAVAAPGEQPATDADPVHVLPCDAIPILQGACTGQSCHGGFASSGYAPAMGMDLSTNASIAATAIDVPSNVATASTEGLQGLLVGDFPKGLKRIRKGSSSESFLIYKLLAHRVEGTVPAPSGPLDVPGLDDATNGRTADELGAVIPGSLMPNPKLPHDPNDPNSFSATGLAWTDLRMIRGWIDQGARVPLHCPEVSGP
jgi:hypothetical protein